MKKHLILTHLLFLLVGITIQAQKEIKIEKVKYSGLIPINKPIFIDSLDLEKKEFKEKNLLATQVDFEKVRKSSQTLSPDTSGVIPLEYAKDKAIQLLLFNIDADKYCKASLKIKSTEMFEIYIDDKLIKSKETKETDISKSNDIETELALEPQRYEVVVKLLVSYKNFNNAALKAWITQNPSDSTANIQVSLNEKRRITINDIIEGTRITDVRISSSGKYFLATYETIYEGGKKEEYHDLRELSSNRLICRLPSSVKPYWMPTSDKIYYWKKEPEENSFYTLDVSSLQETLVFKGVKSNATLVAPNEKFIILHQSAEIPAEKKALKRTLSPSDRAGTFRSRNTIGMYSMDTEVFQKLTFGQRNTYALDISSDSKNLLFMTSEEDLSQPRFGKIELFLINLETYQIDTLANDRAISHAEFSPDGKQILIHANAEAFDGIGLNIKEGQIANTYDGQAFIMNLKDKKIVAITKNFNPSISATSWSAFDNKIYFQTEDEDRVQIFCYDPNNQAFEKLDLGEDIVNKFQMPKSSPVAIYRGESASNSYRLYSYNVKTKSKNMLSDPYQSRLSEIQLGEIKDWNFTSSGGTEIKGRYYLPPQFDPGKKYPLIVYYYGGTSPTPRVFETTYPLNVYAALGYVVYTLQPSGSTGFGQEFSARHVNAWGNPSADEIIEGTKKFCEEHAFVNSSKIGCIGASYGGFMTQYLLTETNLFSAAVSHAGISALSSYWGEGYWGYAYSSVASAGSYPWNNPDLYVKQSPLFHADKINTPLLLLHGSADTNVPVGESIQMFNALKILGKQVELIQVEGENHAIYNYQKRIDWNKTIYSWFAKWLKDQPEWWNSLYPSN